MGADTDKAASGIETAVKTPGKSVSDTAVRDEIDKALRDNSITTAAQFQQVDAKLETDKILPAFMVDKGTQDALFAKYAGTNGELDQEKLKAAVANPDANDSPVNRLLAQAIVDRFSKMDTDGNKSVSRAEMAAWGTAAAADKTETVTENGVTRKVDKSTNPATVLETKGPDGTVTAYKYDEPPKPGNPTLVTQTDGTGTSQTTYTRNAAGGYDVTTASRDKPRGNWEKDTKTGHVDGLSVDTIGDLVTKTGTVEQVQRPDGTKVVTADNGRTRTTYGVDDKGRPNSISVERGHQDDNRGFVADGKPAEKLIKEGDKWFLQDPNNPENKAPITNVQATRDGGYSFDQQVGGVKRHLVQEGYGARHDEYTTSGGTVRTETTDPSGQLTSIVTKDAVSGKTEMLQFGKDGKPMQLLIFDTKNPQDDGHTVDLKTVKYDSKTGSYSYLEADGQGGKRMVKQTGDGGRLEGPPPTKEDGSDFKPTKVYKATGDVFDVQYDKDGNVAQLTQTWPKGDNGKPRDPETWDANPNKPGLFNRSSDGMPGRDLAVDSEGTFSYTYPDAKGHQIRHFDGSGGQSEDVQLRAKKGDQQFGNRKFSVDDQGNMSYDIERGDTLWKIASDALVGRGFNADDISNADILRMIQEIAKANGIADPNKIAAGYKGLKVPR